MATYRYARQDPGRRRLSDSAPPDPGIASR